jgi:hypothetical protein
MGRGGEVSRRQRRLARSAVTVEQWQGGWVHRQRGSQPGSAAWSGVEILNSYALLHEAENSQGPACLPAAMWNSLAAGGVVGWACGCRLRRVCISTTTQTVLVRQSLAGKRAGYESDSAPGWKSMKSSTSHD